MNIINPKVLFFRRCAARIDTFVMKVCWALAVSWIIDYTVDLKCADPTLFFFFLQLSTMNELIPVSA